MKEVKTVTKRLSVHVGKYRYEIFIKDGVINNIEKSERVFLSSLTREAKNAILDRIDRAGFTTEIDDHGVVYVECKPDAITNTFMKDSYN